MPTNKDIEEKIDSVNIEMVKGIAVINTNIEGIHRRLDILNGKVSDHEKRLNQSDLGQAKLNGKFETESSWRSWLLPTLSAILTGLMVYLFTN